VEARDVERFENLKYDEQFQCAFYKQGTLKKKTYTPVYTYSFSYIDLDLLSTNTNYYCYLENTHLIQFSKFPENELG
jgi:hypothetical protein